MEFSLGESDRRALLASARESIASRLENRAPHWPPYGPALDAHCGAFVTLHEGGQLRGCIGRMSADEPLRQVVRSMAQAAAFEDPRFKPISRTELARIHIEISVLSPLEDCGIEDITPGKHGALLTMGWHSGVFLPQVATEQGWDRDEFLDNLCMKAGLAPGAHRQHGARLQRFTALVFGEEAPC